MNRLAKKMLVLGDIHAPFCDWDLLEEARSFGVKHKADLVLCTGDLTDQKSWSRFLKEPGDDNPETEWNKTQKAAKELAKMFPNLVIRRSNHDERYIKKATEAGICKSMLRSLDELFPYKGWVWALDPNPYVIDDIALLHGDELQGSVKAKVQQLGMNVIQGHCLPQSYKVLTETRGFVPITHVLIGERVYGFNDGRIVLSEVLDTVQYRYTGTLTRFEHPRMRQVVTSGHHFKLADDRYLGLNQCIESGITMKELPFYMSPIESDGDIDISDDMLRIIVAIAADGSWDGPYKNLRFHLKKDRKRERLTKLFESVNQTIEWSPSYGGRFKSKGICREFRNQLFELIPDKKLPSWFRNLSVEQTTVVIDELQYWDGCCIINASYQYSSSKREEAELVCEMLLKCGYTSRVLKRQRLNAINNPNYIVTFRLNRTTANVAQKPISEYIEPEYVEDFPVACLSTDSKSFVIMTDDGSVEFTGNSHKAEITYHCTFNRKLWGMDVGCMVDPKSAAFEYAAKYLSKIWTGFGWVNDGVPFLFPKKG